MRTLLLSSILLAGLLSGCTSERPNTDSLSPLHGQELALPAFTAADFPLALNITGDIGLRLATRGHDCHVQAIASIFTDGPGPWMMVLEEGSGARFLYGYSGVSVHALQYDSMQDGNRYGQTWNITVGAGEWQGKADWVTIAVKNLTWHPNDNYTGNSTFKVQTDCHIEAVQHFAIVQIADDYSFRGGVGAAALGVTPVRTNVNDQWAVTVPGNVTLVGRHDQEAFRVDWNTPAGPLVWQNKAFLAMGPPGSYEASLASGGDGFLMLAVLSD